MPGSAGTSHASRPEIIPSPPEQATEPSTDDTHAPVRMSWARLLKRVFDIEHCPNCGGSLKIIPAIEYPPVIVKILSHLGLPTRAPPRAPTRTVRILAKYAKTDEEGQRVLEVVRESISVFRFIYDHIAERAIAAGRK